MSVSLVRLIDLLVEHVGALHVVDCGLLWIGVYKPLETRSDKRATSSQPCLIQSMLQGPGVGVYRSTGWSGPEEECGGGASDHQIFMQFFGRKFGRHDSITLWCILPAWKLYMFQFHLKPLDVALWGEGVVRSSNEQVWTGLQWSPPDVSGRGGGYSRWGGGGYAKGWDPNYPMIHMMYLPPPPQTEWQTPVKTLPFRNFVGGR